jgi:hypothetical protein
MKDLLGESALIFVEMMATVLHVPNFSARLIAIHVSKNVLSGRFQAHPLAAHLLAPPLALRHRPAHLHQRHTGLSR